MKIDVLTLFPNMINPIINESIIKRAILNNKVNINTIDIRDFVENKNKKVDDTPYGGGAGMVISVEPVYKALCSVKKENTKVILMSPRGKVFTQEYAKNLRNEKHLVIISGHYEGIDERINNYIDEEISIGDYVLTGGEIPALVLIDSVVRLLDNVIRKDSHEDDSFSNGLLEYPHYTRPREFNNLLVPEVLLNGNHEEIRKYRLKESIRKTYLNRKDLIEKKELNEEEKKMLGDVINESNGT